MLNEASKKQIPLHLSHKHSTVNNLITTFSEKQPARKYFWWVRARIKKKKITLIQTTWIATSVNCRIFFSKSKYIVMVEVPFHCNLHFTRNKNFRDYNTVFATYTDNHYKGGSTNENI